MTDGTGLTDARILVLEDDYYLATDLQAALEAAGAVVIGPFSDEAEADRAIATALPDCAFLDLNLGGGPTFALPRALMRQGVPFAFVTGYDAEAIPAEFDGVERIEKPIDTRKLARAAAFMLSGPTLRLP